MSVEITHIRHVGLFTPNLEEHARFYSDVWGLERVAGTPDAVFLRGSSPEQFILSLHQGKARGLHHIAYAMAGEEEVRHAARALKAAGGGGGGEATPPGSPRRGYCFDTI